MGGSGRDSAGGAVMAMLMITGRESGDCVNEGFTVFFYNGQERWRRLAVIVLAVVINVYGNWG